MRAASIVSQNIRNMTFTCDREVLPCAAKFKAHNPFPLLAYFQVGKEEAELCSQSHLVCSRYF